MRSGVFVAVWPLATSLLCCSPILRQLRRLLPTFLAAISGAILPIPHTHPPAAGCHSFRKAVGGDVVNPSNMAPLRGSFLAVLAVFPSGAKGGPIVGHRPSPRSSPRGISPLSLPLGREGWADHPTGGVASSQTFDLASCYEGRSRNSCGAPPQEGRRVLLLIEVAKM